MCIHVKQVRLDCKAENGTLGKLEYSHIGVSRRVEYMSEFLSFWRLFILDNCLKIEFLNTRVAQIWRST
jgi:hypothetical protein